MATPIFGVTWIHHYPYGFKVKSNNSPPCQNNNNNTQLVINQDAKKSKSRGNSPNRSNNSHSRSRSPSHSPIMKNRSGHVASSGRNGSYRKAQGEFDATNEILAQSMKRFSAGSTKIEQGRDRGRDSEKKRKVTDTSTTYSFSPEGSPKNHRYGHKSNPPTVKRSGSLQSRTSNSSNKDDPSSETSVPPAVTLPKSLMGGSSGQNTTQVNRNKKLGPVKEKSFDSNKDSGSHSISQHEISASNTPEKFKTPACQSFAQISNHSGTGRSGVLLTKGANSNQNIKNSPDTFKDQIQVRIVDGAYTYQSSGNMPQIDWNEFQAEIEKERLRHLDSASEYSESFKNEQVASWTQSNFQNAQRY